MLKYLYVDIPTPTGTELLFCIEIIFYNLFFIVPP